MASDRKGKLRQRGLRKGTTCRPALVSLCSLRCRPEEDQTWGIFLGKTRPRPSVLCQWTELQGAHETCCCTWLLLPCGKERKYSVFFLLIPLGLRTVPGTQRWVINICQMESTSDQNTVFFLFIWFFLSQLYIETIWRRSGERTKNVSF